VSRKNVEDIYPLTSLQEGMVFHSLHTRGAYVEQFPFVVHGGLRVEAYARAYQRVVDRHAILRSAFVWEGVPRPVQVVAREARVPVTRLDWRGVEETAWRARLDALLREGREQGFDLRRAPLTRLTFADLDGGRTLVVLAIHHALLDGWSLAVVQSEMDAFYRGELEGRLPALPPAPRFRDYVAWLQGRDPAAAEAFWRDRLAGFAAPTPLPLDRGGDAVAAEHAAVQLRLEGEDARRLHGFVRAQALTLNTLVQGAWALLLSRYAGEKEVVFGATVSGRPAELPRIEEMVGAFINTLPVRVEVPASAPVAGWLAALQRGQAAVEAYEHTPLVAVQGWSELPRDRPLFESLVVVENVPVGEDTSGLRAEWIPQPERTNYALTLVVVPTAEWVELRLSYDARRFAAGDARTLTEALAATLRALAADPARAVGAVSVLLPAARERVLGWGRRDAPYPRGATVDALFAEAAAARPDASALEWQGRTLTYGELDEASARLAHHLRALGVGEEGVVAVAMERRPEPFVAVLAALRAGGAYLPLDPAHPAARLEEMMRGAGARVLVVADGVPEALGGWEGPVVSLAADAERIAACPAEPPAAAAHPERVAYLVYTSGSTGRPKGIGVTHRGLVRLVRGADYHPFGPGDRIAQVVGPSFDVLSFEVWGALLSGGTLVGIGREEVLDPARLGATLAERGITAAFVTSALFAQAAREAPGGFRGVRTLMVGGEAVDPAAARAVLEAGGPERLLNGYGPAENATYSTTHAIEAVPEGAVSVPIGQPVANSTAYVVGAGMQLLPAGAWGELHVGGDGLARGYVGRPGLTAERFVPDPFGAPGGRLYRTGDRARWRADGVLEFGGRVDFQVKIRGVRIEPGEVEAALTALPEVGEAVVVAREDRPGDRRLVAYVTPAAGGEPEEGALRAALARTLPEAMVPSAVVVLERLPLTPNGKVDRGALPAPTPAAAEAFVAPATETELLLARLWSEVLRVERVGAGDSFFALGGHSLLATRIVSALRAEAGVELPLREVFELPVLRDLAARIDALAAGDGLDELAAALGELPAEELEALLGEGA
jgi:amino acid adenylation domain-containing protein